MPVRKRTKPPGTPEFTTLRPMVVQIALVPSKRTVLSEYRRVYAKKGVRIGVPFCKKPKSGLAVEFPGVAFCENVHEGKPIPKP